MNKLAWKYHFISYVLLQLLLAGAPMSVSGQGFPFIRSFSKTEYKGGTQSWDFCQDADGILYVANNEGLGEFDGTAWNMHPVLNKTIIRSAVVDHKGRIYTGAQGEVGYFFPDAFGRLQYTSFYKQLQQLKRRPEDFWNGLLTPDSTILFQSSNQIIELQEARIKSVWFPSGNFIYMQRIGNQLIAQDSRRGLLLLKPGGETQLLLPIPENDLEIVSILDRKNEAPLVCTRNGKLFIWQNQQLIPWKTAAATYLLQHRIYTATQLTNGMLAFGTSQGGVVVLHPNGSTRIILTRKNGLQNNNILSLFADRQGNLWVGTDNGLDYVQINSPYSFLVPDGDLEGTAYSAAFMDKTAFLATSNGIYSGKQDASGTWASAPFSLIPPTQGQAWSVQHIQGELLIGHHEGPFVFAQGNAQRIGDRKGTWTFVPLERNPNLLLCGAYDGIYLFERKGSTWIKKMKYPGLNESCRILALENDRQLWVAHPYRGIFSVRFSSDYMQAQIRFFNAENGLPSDNLNHAFKIGDEIVFATENGLYRFDKLKANFERYPVLDDVFTSYERVKYLREGYQGEIWFAADNDVGYLKPENTSGSLHYKRIVLPFLRGKLVGGFEFIFPFDPQTVLFGADKGFIFLNKSIKPSKQGKLLLREIRLTNQGDSLLFVSRPGIQGTSQPTIQLKSWENSLRFKFVLPDLTLESGIQYRWRLLGVSSQWSAWSSENQKDFAQLPPGKYQFEAEARAAEGQQVSSTSCSFRIYPPWYLSKTAWLIYLFFTAIGLLLLVVIPQRRFKREKEQLTITHQREQEVQQLQVEAAQKEVQLIREAKLQDEIQFKNQELAATTFHLVQKSEILHNTSEQLVEISRQCSDEPTRKAILSVIRDLTQPDQLDKDWEVFAQRFDQVHANFLRRLKETFPQITPKDQKLCAYLRLNLSSKEIAPLLGISVRSVEVSRYRLRRKLDLETEENLTEFLLKF